jgi:N-alpha-acetyltransferase 15/16, NatA auxiliary subunit
MRPLLIKGVPSVIQDLKEFYRDNSNKPDSIEQVLSQYRQTLDQENKLDGEECDPTVTVWLLYFTAYHFYFKRDFPKALDFLSQAILHTPTLIDLYTLKAKVLFKSGLKTEAAHLFEEAR